MTKNRFGHFNNRRAIFNDDKLFTNKFQKKWKIEYK